MPVNIGDVEDPGEEAQEKGDAVDDAQPEGRLAGLAPERPKQRDEGEEQQVALVIAGKGRDQEES